LSEALGFGKQDIIFHNEVLMVDVEDRELFVISMSKEMKERSEIRKSHADES